MIKKTQESFIWRHKGTEQYLHVQWLCHGAPRGTLISDIEEASTLTHLAGIHLPGPTAKRDFEPLKVMIETTITVEGEPTQLDFSDEAAKQWS